VLASESSTSALLAEIASGGREDDVGIDELLQRVSKRAFGLLLFAVTLPAFLPLPVGVGAFVGPLVMLVGVQLLIGMRRPWVPAALRRRGVARASFRRFVERLNPWLQRLERLCAPRLEYLTAGLAGNIVTGALLIILGVLLTLPIPFTNYPFGLLIMLFAVALIERDGALLAIAWGLGGAAIAASLLLSKELIDLIGRVF